MKKTLLTIIFGILLCSSTKIENNNIKYFDENYKPISKIEYKNRKLKNSLLSIQGDSINHKILALREERGKINNRPLLQSILEKEIGQKIDSDKPMVIIYYPGRDPLNGCSNTDRKHVNNWYGLVDEGLKQVAEVTPIYIYKNTDYLKKLAGPLTWHKDPGGTIERLFFEYHYPCDSFVVISKDGNYISYFGEFTKELVWEATQLMNK